MTLREPAVGGRGADPWGPLTTVMNGPLTPGTFDLTRQEVVPGRLAPMATYAFDGVSASDAEFDLIDVGLTVSTPTSTGAGSSRSAARQPK